MTELYLELREGALPPVLLATPTVLTGHLDPDMLVDRLAACAAAGVEPLTADLLQALLVRRTHVEPRPVVAVLAEAARQGAYAEVWRMLTSLLPVLLPGQGERPSVVHVEAMTLAADAAAWAGARGPIPQVTALAAGPGRNRFTRACARLRDQLGG